MNIVDPRTQRTTQAQSLPPLPAASCISGLPAASASSPALFPSILFLFSPISHYPLPLPGRAVERNPLTSPLLGYVWVLWDINWLARAKERGGWGVGSRLGTLNIGTGRGQEPQDWILRLAILRVTERKDLGFQAQVWDLNLPTHSAPAPAQPHYRSWVRQKSHLVGGLGGVLRSSCVDWGRAQAPGCSAQNLPHPLVSHSNWSQPKGSVPMLLARWGSQLLKDGRRGWEPSQAQWTLPTPTPNNISSSSLEGLDSGCLRPPCPETSKSETLLSTSGCRTVGASPELAGLRLTSGIISWATPPASIPEEAFMEQ